MPTSFLHLTLKQIHRLVASLDATPPPLIKWLPPRVKRGLVRRFFRLFAPLLANRPIPVDGFHIYVPAREVRSYLLGEFEPHIRTLIRRYLRPGMVAVDVGANIGLHTLQMARAVGPQGRVYAVEPASDNLKYLKRNIALNRLSQVEVLPWAASSEHGIQEFYLNESPTMHSLYSYRTSHVRSALTVKTAPLDDYIEGPVHFIKIDIEGGELEAFRGMQRILKENTQLHLVIEWRFGFLMRLIKRGMAPDALPLLLSNLGFEMQLAGEPVSRPQSTVDDIIRRLHAQQLPSDWRTDLHAYKLS